MLRLLSTAACAVSPLLVTGASVVLASVLSLTDDSQIGANLRVCADEEDRADFDQRR
jgi:hypothetical protein